MQESTVYVQREAPTLDELRALGAARFQSIALESTARPQKRSFERCTDYPSRGSSFHAPPQARRDRQKRQRVDPGPNGAEYDPDEPVASSESPMGTCEGHGQDAPRQTAAVNIRNPQPSPERNCKLSLCISYTLG